MFQDVKIGLRILARNRSLTAVAVITFALGIGATAAIYAVCSGVLLRPLPFAHSAELVYIKENRGPKVGITSFVGYSDFVDWRNQSRTLKTIAAYMYSWMNLTGGAEAERVTCGAASASFFTLLGVQPAVGRLFLPDDDRAGSPLVAILSHGLWERRFGGDTSVVGKGLTLDGKSYTVVGVLPATFLVPDKYRIEYALWVPLSGGPYRTVRAIGRLQPGVGLAAARSELDTILWSTSRDGIAKSVIVSTWQEEITAGARRSLLLLLSAVGFLLFIACANVANLLLSRAVIREKEMAIRLAVGAGTARIVRQLITESTLLALIGGLIGLGLARWGTNLLLTFISPNLPTLGPINLDWRVLVFSLVLTVLTGFAFGLAPALRASRVSLNEALKEGTGSVTEFRSHFIFRNLLVIGEIGLATALLVGAGLLLRSFLRVRGLDMGFKSENVLSMTIDLTPSGYVAPGDQSRFFRQVIEGIRGLQGVRSVAGSSCPPLGNRMDTVMTEVALEGRMEEIPSALSARVTPDYFRTMRIPLLQGRYFTDADREGFPSVAIITESFARRFCSSENCRGGRIRNWVHKNDWLTIVGVVGDARDWPESEPTPKIYLPYLQASGRSMTLLVSTAGDPTHWATQVRSQVAAVDRDQPSHDLMTLDELRARFLAPRRVSLVLVGTFAALGLLLASVGIYGVVSYSVSHRTREIGVRMAMGAGQGDVLRLVVGQGFRLTLIGTGIGLAISMVVTRLMRTMLFGVKSADLLTMTAVSLSLMIVALLACYIPARRATGVDPVSALRHE
ncbi:MAG: ABC transporter permease [Acidobacteriia bacterium]|nr:ABC transporter permease [Terriglobia bacterium]